MILLNIGNNIPFIFLEFVLVFFNDKNAPLLGFLQSHTLTYPNFFDNSTGIGLPIPFLPVYIRDLLQIILPYPKIKFLGFVYFFFLALTHILLYH